MMSVHAHISQLSDFALSLFSLLIHVCMCACVCVCVCVCVHVCVCVCVCVESWHTYTHAEDERLASFEKRHLARQRLFVGD